MKYEYLKEMRSSFLKIESEMDSYHFQMKMVMNNQIEGLLGTTSRQINNEICYLYHISSGISILEYFASTPMKVKDLMMFLESMKALMGNLENYLLNPDAILLDPESIFIDINTGAWRFCYFTENNRTFALGLRSLFEFIIQRVDHGDSEAVTYAYGIYKRICMGQTGMEELFTIYQGPEVKSCEIREESIPVDTVIPEVVTEEIETTDQNKLFAIYIGGSVLVFMSLFFFMGALIPGVRVFGLSGVVCLGIGGISLVGLILLARFVMTTPDLLVSVKTVETQIPYAKEKVTISVPEKTEDRNLTRVLNEDMDKGMYPELKWEDGVATFHFPLKEQTTIIGSSKDRADCVIPLSGVSRMHARITKEGAKYYIKDLNSTNGTQVNGRELSCFEICEIHGNDSIVLGNVKCLFV